MTIESILQDADRALAGALQSDARARLDAMTRFMRAFELLAKEVASGNGSWGQVRAWAQGIVEPVCTARPALADWEVEMGQLFYRASRDENEAESALDRRTQHALARDAFRDTPVDAMMADFEDAEFDRDLRDEAERLALEAPSYAPESHHWWRRRQE